MSTGQGTVAQLLGFVGDALAPLAYDLATPEDALELLSQLGLELDAVPASVSSLQASASQVADDVAALQAADDTGVIESIALAISIAELTQALVRLGPDLVNELGEQTQAPSLSVFGQRLLDRLLLDAVNAQAPSLHAALTFTGIFVVADDPEDELADVPSPDIEPPAYYDLELRDEQDDEEYARPLIDFAEAGPEPNVRKKREFRVDRITGLLQSFAALFEQVHGWGTENFDGDALLDVLHKVFVRQGVSAHRQLRADPDDDTGAILQLNLPVFSARGLTGTTEFGAGLVALAPSADDTNDAGWAIAPFAKGADALSFPLGSQVTLTLDGDLDLSGAIQVEIRPPLAIEVAANPFSPQAGELSGSLLASLDIAFPADTSVLGAPGLVSLTGDSWGIGFGLTLDGTSLTPVFSIHLNGGVLELDASDGDAFLTEVVPQASVKFDTGVEWSVAGGFRITGSGDLEIIIPVGQNIGPVQVLEIALALAAENESLLLSAGLTASLEIGPFSGSVDGIGIELPVAIAADGGNLGYLDIEPVRFKPPHGVGFSVDAGVASGGGYLSLEDTEYAGVLELSMLGVGINAIGLIATELPQGRSGWSMFLSLSATFTGLQLGFGFTLNGVGGLVGVHRGLDAEALGDGIRTGAMDSILFPDDPVGDATRILSELDSVFPVQLDQYVFGPIAKVGWGTPTLIEADLGVVVQLPEPLTFTLLGSLGAELPDEEAALLVLNIDVAGTFDVTAVTVSIDASLRDSRVLTLCLSGDMAMRAALLDSPSFLLSFGGFNPHFAPPANFPDLNRLSVSLETGNILRVGLWGYFGLTSNTVQFGAGADVWAQAAGLTIEGHFDFDALIQFSPFAFIVELGFSVDVQAATVDLFGVNLDVLFEGPNPFHFVGTASMKILGIKTSFRVDETIGRKEIEAPRETVYALELLLDALRDPSAWREALPEVTTPFANLTDAPSDEVAVHPAGSIEVVQRVVPLKRTLDKFGTANLGGLTRFELLDPTIGGSPSNETADVEDWFAPAQYYSLSDEERLSAPSFEQMPGGQRMGSERIAQGRADEFVLDYEQIVRDPDAEVPEWEMAQLYHPTAHNVALAVNHSSSTRTRRNAGLAISGQPESPYAIAATSWVVSDTATAEVDTTMTPPRGTSWSEARSALAQGSGESRTLAPSHEVRAAS